MSRYRLTEINIYPVKSLGGVAVSEGIAVENGLLYDRRWMLVDDNNRFITQREHPVMALIGIKLTGEGFCLYRKDEISCKLNIPFTINKGKRKEVVIWKDVCDGLHYSTEADKWISSQIGTECSFIYMPETTMRYVDRNYAHKNETVSFADGYPYLIIGEESLNELNSRLNEKMPMNRFRPNLVFSGGKCFDEDDFGNITIGSARFKAAKRCSRCVITTVDQDTGIKGKEPLVTLSTFRTSDNNIYFGQNLLLVQAGIVRLGDEILLN